MHTSIEARTDDKYKFPAVRIRPKSGDSVEVLSNNNSTVVEPSEMKRLNISVGNHKLIPNKSSGKRPVELNHELKISNHGLMEVFQSE
jgi:hypothetical protein